jgi:hypothetical protein
MTVELYYTFSRSCALRLPLELSHSSVVLQTLGQTRAEVERKSKVSSLSPNPPDATSLFPPHRGPIRAGTAATPHPPHDLDLTRLPLPPSASHLLAAAAVLGLLGGLLLYMLPRKRGVDAGEVQDLHNKAPRAAPAQDKDREEVAEMAGRAPEIDEDLHSRQLAVYGRETMKRLFGSNVLVSGLQGLGAEIGISLLVMNFELMYVQE